MGLPSVSTGNMSILKFAGIGAAGIWLGDMLHGEVQDRFPETFGARGDVPTQTQQWLGYGIVTLGIVGALMAAHALFGRKS
jgi:hypothetical protein